jgi:alpha-mannosidase
MIPESLSLSKINKRIAQIGGLVYPDSVAITEVALAETPDHLPWEQAVDLSYAPVEDGHRWGTLWGTGWFRLRVTLPPTWSQQTLALHFQPGGEALVYLDGRPYHGLDSGRTVCLLPPNPLGTATLELYVETLAGDTVDEGLGWSKRTMRQPSLSRYDAGIWELWHQLKALAELAPELPEGDVWRAQLIHGLSQAVDRFDVLDHSPEAQSRSIQLVSAHLRPLLDHHAADSAPTAACVANAHIDLAWRWPFRETRRKSARTFANVLRLQERYPELCFHQSQVFLYECVKETQPHLYAQIQERQKEGRIRVVGSMYIEPDCNIPDGESLVRQILYGTRFFEQEFGVRSPFMWLPDTFGFPGSLPQLIERSGLKWFFTHKTAWSIFAPFPHHSFVWQGIDGTRVLSHATPSNSYNSEMEAQHLRYSMRNFKQKESSNRWMIPFGRGDGGGGPVPQMLERIRNYHDLEGLPKLEITTPEAFFEALEAERETLPTWCGELQVDRHRGVLVSQGHLKRLNRRIESLLHDVEVLATLANTSYPAQELEAAWKELLLHHFHDVICGCSITEVHIEADQRLATLAHQLETLRDHALDDIAAQRQVHGDGEPVMLANTLGWSRHEPITVAAPAATVVDELGHAVPSQSTPDGQLCFRAQAPALGQSLYFLRKTNPPKAQPRQPDATDRLENAALRVDLDAQGRMIGVLDKRLGRQVLAPGQIGNQLRLYRDIPVSFDAWEVEPWTRDSLLEADGRLISSGVVESGPVRTVLRQVREIGGSRVTQDLVLDADRPLLQFQTAVEWGPRQNVLLMAAFPVNVLSDRAAYEIPFGHVYRPTHMNTPNEEGNSVSATQKWADLSEPDFGVALLNDGRYGYQVLGQTISLALLRAPTYPDPQADVGKTHTFTYALLPHGPGLTQVIQAGYELNHPLLARQTTPHAGRPAITPPLLADHDGIVIETIKPAQDGQGVIVRLYETLGCRGPRRFQLHPSIGRVLETDLLERNETTLPMDGHTLQLHLGPFQIRTLRLLTHD